MSAPGTLGAIIQLSMQKRFTRPDFTWLSIIIALGGTVILVVELVFRLSSLTYHKLAWSEILINQQSHSWHNIAANPLGGPLLVLERLTTYLDNASAFWLRLPSAIAGIIAIWFFYYIARRWFNRFTAVISSFLLMTSAIFLHLSRLAATDVLYLMAPLALISYATYSARRRATGAKQLPLWVPIGLLSVGLYIPAFIWLTLVVFIIQPNLLAIPWKTSSKAMRLFSVIFALLLLVPLVSAFVRQPSELIRSWLGLGTLAHPTVMLHRLADIPYNLFLSGPTNRVLWLGRVPILPAAITVLILLGAYELATKRHRQGWLIGSLLLVSCLVSAVGGLTPLALFIGPLYIIAAAGIRQLINQWFAVFPRNPFARSLGYIVIACFCAVMVAYGWHAYYVAWPHNSQTHQVFIYNVTDASTDVKGFLIQ